MLENKNLENYSFEDKLLDLTKLEIGKVYPSFDDGKIKPSRLCFIKIKEKLDDGYIVDVEWDKDVVALNQKMVYTNEHRSLRSLNSFGGVITNNIYDIINDLYINGYLYEDELEPSILKNS